MTEEIIYTARGVAADPDDVLIPGNRGTVQPEYDEYDPLLNGAPITEPVAVAAAATTATQSWAAPVEPVTQTPPVASVDVPPSATYSSLAACTGSTNGEPVAIAPAPEGYPQQSQYAQPAVQDNQPLQTSTAAAAVLCTCKLNNLRNNLTTLRGGTTCSATVLRPCARITGGRNAGSRKSSNPLLLHSLQYQTDKLIKQPAAQEPLYQQPKIR